LGGGEQYVLDLAKRQMRDGHPLALISGDSPIIRRKLSGTGAKHYVLKFRSFLNPFSIFETRRIIRREKIKRFTMKFMSIEEFQESAGQLRKMLVGNEKIVLIINGKPAAIVIGTDEDSFEDIINSINSAKAWEALKEIRNRAKEEGLDKLTLKEINSEIADNRKEK
jgi:Mg2+/Co2+ transporter CorB